MELNGKAILSLSEHEMRHVRGNDVAMIFQEPMTSLNPVFTIGRQISEVLIRHKGMTKGQAREKRYGFWKRYAFPMRLVVSTSIRINFPAACASVS